MFHAGPHYYVLSLGRRSNVLMEAFRDTLIDIENGGFPVIAADGGRDPRNAGDRGPLRDALQTVDRCFTAYQRQEPLTLVLVGEPEVLSMFSSVTAHGDIVVGRVEGDHSGTPPGDLGKIVWPVVKYAMSGLQDRAIRDLEVAAKGGRLVSGIEAVSRSLGRAAGATLLVEGDYHVRGSVYGADDALTVSPEVDVSATLDDVVDIVIEKTLAAGGHVVFVPENALAKFGRIALLLLDDERARAST